MEITEKGYEIVTEVLNDVLNKAVVGIQTESAVSSLFEIKALSLAQRGTGDAYDTRT